MTEIDAAHRAVVRSRETKYLNRWDSTSRELATAIDALHNLEKSLRRQPPSPELRHQLRSELGAFRAELRLATSLHERAAIWEDNRALAVKDILGLRAAAYGPDGALSAGTAIRRKAWEG
jgi:hypothetical protein